MPVGCRAHADDLTLISLTVKGLQTILDITSEKICSSKPAKVQHKSAICVFRRQQTSKPFNPEFTVVGSMLPVKASVSSRV